MKKYESMVERNKNNSKRMFYKVEIALKEISANNQLIKVTSLQNATGFSRSYFYNNSNVRRLIDEFRAKQKALGLPNRSCDSIINAKNLVINKLERNLKNCVNSEEYEKVVCENKELKKKFKQLNDELVFIKYKAL